MPCDLLQVTTLTRDREKLGKEGEGEGEKGDGTHPLPPSLTRGTRDIEREEGSREGN